MKQVAIITGASRGIGKACAVGFAGMGYQTVLIARDKKKLQAAANEITEKYQSGKTAPPILYAFDVTDSGKVGKTVKEVAGKFGRIDVLVNNAGIYYDGTSGLSAEGMKEMLDTNLTAAFGFIKNVVPIMKNQKKGHIFNIASRSGKIGFPDSGGYSASKFGLVGLSHALTKELGEFGISVTAICPGWVDTDMADQAGAPFTASEMIQPQDIFRTMEWLLRLSPAVRVKEVVLETVKSIY
jgi:3-oxoacyl-[acyl-carrier protein] reductase